MVSLSIGSTWITAGMTGIGLMGIAVNMALSPAITAGVDLYPHRRATALISVLSVAPACAGARMLRAPARAEATPAAAR